jgi:hypothetical protein
LFATANGDADTKKAGAETASNSDSEPWDGKSDGDNDNEAEAITTASAEAITTASIIPGHKIELIDGHNKTWATTVVIDIEPKMPDDWHEDGRAGDYILVRGGTKQSGTENGMKAMIVATKWNDVQLFKKPPKRKKVTDYQKFPGILQFDWMFFDRDIAPADLMRTEEFLVDVQHVKTKTVKAKKQTKASTKD